MVDPQVIAFAGIAGLLTITPGADTMIILRSVFARGWKSGILTMIGVCSGLFCHATLSALGLSLILVRSATAFDIVKVVGACYLIFLGGQSLWNARFVSGNTYSGLAETERMRNRTESWKAFYEGTLTNLLNPKVAIFYLAFLPQFISPHDWVFGKSVLLAVIHFTQGIIWYSILIFFVGRMRLLFVRPRIRTGLETLTGAILIGFGLRLALEHR